MTLSGVLFVVIAAVVAVSALGVVLSRHIVRMAVWLLFSLVGVALLYFLLGAEFLGAAQMIVYVGGILVLLVFGVMLTAQGPWRELRTAPVEWAVGGVLAGVLLILVISALWRLPAPQASSGPLPGTAPLGLGLLGVQETTPSATLSGLPEEREKLGRTPVAYLLPFEIVSVHLLVVLIGAAYLARARRKMSAGPASTGSHQPSEPEASSAKVDGPLSQETPRRDPGG